MASLLEVIVLSIIQGIAEWFPVSSSGHLAILHNVFGFQDLAFDVFLHFASILAVIIVFWKDMVSIFYPLDKRNIRYLLLLVLGIIPAAIVGLLFKEEIEGFFSSLFYLGIFFIISGILVYSAKFSREKNKRIGVFDSIFIGIFQAVAILPGISRSGATISTGMFRGLSKEQVVRFSFLMAIPVVLGAGLIEAKDIVYSNINYNLLLISFIVTFIVSLFTIKLLLKIIKSERFYLFGIYNFVLGLIILIWSFVR